MNARHQQPGSNGPQAPRCAWSYAREPTECLKPATRTFHAEPFCARHASEARRQYRRELTQLVDHVLGFLDDADADDDRVHSEIERLMEALVVLLRRPHPATPASQLVAGPPRDATNNLQTVPLPARLWFFGGDADADPFGALLCPEAQPVIPPPPGYAIEKFIRPPGERPPGEQAPVGGPTTVTFPAAAPTVVPLPAAPWVPEPVPTRLEDDDRPADVPQEPTR